MAKWNNAKYQELKSKNNNEAQQIYDDYKESSQESNEFLTGTENEANSIYQNYKENKSSTSEVMNSSPDKLYSNFESSKSDTRLYAYDVYIGDSKLPVTPENIPTTGGTEVKSFKLASGKELITGVLSLAREVKIDCYFPYFTDGELSPMLPNEYVSIYNLWKSQEKVLAFQISETKESFNVIITGFDYTFIPGRDVDYSMTLKEVLEVTSNVLEI